MEEIDDIGKKLKETEELLDRVEKNTKAFEEEAVKNILKYFDRLHDKIFTFNNILIAGYFALITIEHNTPSLLILIPVANLILILYLEYRMMEKSRFEADWSKKGTEERKKHNESSNSTNLYSLLSMASTFVVTVIFLYKLIIG